MVTPRRVLVIFMMLVSLSLANNPSKDDVPYVWPHNIVYYEMKSNVTPDSKAAFLRASKIFSDSTCVKFNETSQGHRISIQGIYEGYNGCAYSRIYNISVIGTGCRMQTGQQAVLSLMVGLSSEDNRYDRDDYVDIIQENIGFNRDQFEKNVFRLDYNISYDYMSVTHLRYFDFSKNDKIRKTIVTKDIRYQYLIGQYGISFKDIRKVNAMYKCNKHCPQRNALYCGSNGGYVGPNCTCICPDGTFGQQCENGKLIVPYTESCTKKITKPGFIQTPSPRTVYEYCSWDIQAPADKIKVQVNFTEFKLINENNTTKLCEHEFLEIRKNESSHEGSYYCGEELNGQTVTSVGRNMKILMNPYASESHKDYVINKTKGFKAIVTFL